jgi:hypothetical protein
MNKRSLIAQLALANAMIGIDRGHPDGDQSVLVSVDYADIEKRVLAMGERIIIEEASLIQPWDYPYAGSHPYRANGRREMSKKKLDEINKRAKTKAARKQRRNQK